MKILLLILTMNFLSLNSYQDNTEIQTGTVSITFTNVQVGKGLVRSAIYKKERFLKRDGEYVDNKTKADQTSITVTYENIPYGTYAIASYQDEDENAKLSKNRIGLPNEAYGFSKPLPSKWRVPKFEDVSFELNSPQIAFEVKLDYWINH